MPIPGGRTTTSVVATQELSPVVSIKINPMQVYIVKPGDWLAKIASHYHTTWKNLYCENRHTIGNNPDLIQPGERLNIDGKQHSCSIGSSNSGSKDGKPTSSGATHIPNPVSNPPQGLSGLKAYALNLLNGNGGEYYCLNKIIMAESGWQVTVHYGGGHGYIGPNYAYGIPQALPGDKMSSEGSDWMTNGDTQLRWMVKYVDGTYGSACSAWSFHLSHGAY